jgi:alkyl sulfatase BDS1-like metallo-beta-lactamase superfamily hydrolase
VNRLSHAVVLRALPRAIAMRFDAAAAGDLDATIELAIRDPQERPPRCFALAIADSRCQVQPGHEPRAGARAVVSADDLIALVRGRVTWPELISSGRFELSGDPFLALRFASLFRLPVRLDPV